MDIAEISCDHIDGHDIVYWEDIESAFPGVQHVKNGTIIVSLMRDSNRISELHCEFVSGLAIATEPFADLSSAEPRQATVTRENTAQIESEFSSVAAAIEQARQSGRPLSAEALSSLIASNFTPASTAKSGFERTVIHKLAGLFEQGAMTQQIARKVWELQKQMNDRLILIQSKTEAILTQ
ncbi:hypothetical protein BGZ96_005227, partial [Linnemannia gamsii]